ncbi:MAG TPA: SDR family NAD(P)-dependent oxidoreductase, partial [Terriglobales bacterium]|nr:SDR family NAD(P)-dependent oxidoreductase [Terriglobales bacterium]
SELSEREQEREWELLVLSAKTESALTEAGRQLAEHLGQRQERHEAINLGDVAYTLGVGRTEYPHRRVLVCRTPQEAIAALDADNAASFTNDAEQSLRTVAFMFPGGGAQYVNMGRELYERERVFREEVDRCAELLLPHVRGRDIRELIFPKKEVAAQAAEEIRRTALGLPALFSIEYALAKLWMRWGVQPQAMIGHSLGEYVAACLAGVFSLEDALAIVAARSRLMQELPQGSMLAVSLAEHEVRPLLVGDLSIAAINGPSTCVISGANASVDEMQRVLAQKQIEYHRLHIEVAAHSSLVEPMLQQFAEVVRQKKLHAPQIPCISNVTGTWITAKDATDPEYWVRHLRQTVRFGDGVAELLRDSRRVLLEAGPGSTLSTLSQNHPVKTGEHVVLTSVRHPKDVQSDVAFLLKTFGRLWSAGLKMDWKQFYAEEKRSRIPLPPYPFERQRYWLSPAMPQGGKRALAKSNNLSDWFYTPLWKQSLRWKTLDHSAIEKQTFLLFADDCGLCDALTAEIVEKGGQVISVLPGEYFKKLGERSLQINPASAADYELLISELRTQKKIPAVVFHCWSVGEGAAPLNQSQERGFFSLLHFAQALGNQNVNESLALKVISSDMQRVIGEKRLSPEKATVLGPCRVIPQEYPNITCQCIDLSLGDNPSWDELAKITLAELDAPGEDLSVAYRGGDRWVQDFDPVHLPENKTAPLRQEGVYLITGGLGGIALELAEFLAANCRAKLALVGRSSLPPKDAWNASDQYDDRTRARIRRVQKLEELGCEVLLCTADVTNYEQMKQVMMDIKSRFGNIHGVIHAAGVAGGGLIQLKTRQDAEAVLGPKVHGTLVLAKLFESRQLDFLVLCSSLSAMVGGLGHVDYSGANAFLDVFAQANRHSGLHAVAIDWNAWQGVGMAANLTLPGDLESWREEVHKKGITANQGVEAFLRIVNAGLPQVAVSTEDLTQLIEQHYTLLPSVAEVEQKTPKEQRNHSRPQLAVEYVAPSNEVEQRIAGIWQGLLAIEPVGIHDNFFSLGGHSLLGTQLISRLRDEFQIQLPLRRIFESPTVAGLAETIAAQLAERQETERLELVKMLEQLPESEIEETLKRLQPEIEISKGTEESNPTQLSDR